MALDIPSFPNPKDRTTPLTDAYAFIAGIGLETAKASGRATLNVYPSLAAYAAGSEVTDQVNVSLGQVLVPADGPTPAVAFRTLAEFMADAAPVGGTGITFAQAYAVVGLAIYLEFVAKHPACAGATIV